MPLVNLGSREAISENIRRERAAGKKQSQAIAIALSVARRSRKADGGNVDDATAAAFPETVGNPGIDAAVRGVVGGLSQFVTTPGTLASTPNPYPPGSEEGIEFERTRQQAGDSWARNAALATMGTGAVAGVPIKAGEQVLGSGFTDSLFHGSPTPGITTLKASERGPLGPGTYASPFEGTAQRYAGPEGTLYQLPQKERDIFNGLGDRYGSGYEGWKSDKQRLLDAAEPDKKEALSAILDKMWTGDGYPMYANIRNLYGGHEGAQELFKRAGFEGLSGHVDGPEVLLFGDQNLKPGIRAYHGSPHDFDAFSLDKIGTGEGAQAYGHGLYFAENPKVAEGYKEALAKDMYYTPSGEMFDPQSQLQHLNVRVAARNNGPDLDATIARAQELLPKASDQTRPMLENDIATLQRFKDAGGISKNPGKMYEVQINADPEHFLDWDKPLSEQPQSVQDAIAKHREQIGQLPRRNAVVQRANDAVVEGTATGGDFINRLARVYERPGIFPEVGIAQPHAASQALREAGIPGIKYLDQGSRGTSLDALQSRLAQEEAGLARLIPHYEAGHPILENYRESIADLKQQIADHKPPTSNYVVFDDKLIDILRKYGLAGLLPGAALSQQGDDHMKRGGVANALRVAKANGGPVFEGYIPGNTGGRTDNKDITVASGSYVIPSDILSGLGEGNSHAGWALIAKEYGLDKPKKADGGEVVPIVAASGEGVIPPQAIVDKHGDLDTGHKILDSLVKHVRSKTIKHLKSLPAPKKN